MPVYRRVGASFEAELSTTTLKVRYNESDRPTTSNPGPIFDDVHGTFIENFRIVNVVKMMEESKLIFNYPLFISSLIHLFPSKFSKR